MVKLFLKKISTRSRLGQANLSFANTNFNSQLIYFQQNQQKKKNPNSQGFTKLAYVATYTLSPYTIKTAR